VILLGSVVAQQGGRLILIHDDDVEVAVIVEIAEGTSAADVTDIDGRAGFVSHAGKGAVAAIAKEHARASCKETWD
jgi:hypothetical protein